MALKTTTAAALQHGHRRRLKPQVLLPMKRSSKLAARFMAVKRTKHGERKIKKQEQQKKRQEETPSLSSTATGTPEPATPTEQQHQHMTAENKQALQHIFGRSFDENDRSAADILATLYMTGLLATKTPAALQGSVSGTATPAIRKFLASSCSCFQN